jgi:SHS2 domain-containing protein
MGRWQEIEHTADVALHLWAEDLEDLFATAARGMFSLITGLDMVPCQQYTAHVVLDAIDVEVLLVDWLNELLYLSEETGGAFVEFQFEVLNDTHLDATACGGAFSEYQTYIKATTFHNLNIHQTSEGYETDVVFDI